MPPDRSDGCTIELAHAGGDGAVSCALRLGTDATVAAALEAARALPAFAHLDLDGAMVAIFGRPVALDRPLGEGDRVEIHACRAVDPKLARRARARGGRMPGGGGGRGAGPQ